MARRLAMLVQLFMIVGLLSGNYTANGRFRTNVTWNCIYCPVIGLNGRRRDNLLDFSFLRWNSHENLIAMMKGLDPSDPHNKKRHRCDVMWRDVTFRECSMEFLHHLPRQQFGWWSFHSSVIRHVARSRRLSTKKGNSTRRDTKAMSKSSATAKVITDVKGQNDFKVERVCSQPLLRLIVKF